MEKQPILLIDNNDSFSSILAQTLRKVDSENREIIIRNYDEMETLPRDMYAYVISPGPGVANEYVKYNSWLEELKNEKVLGVCLGMQLMGLWQGYELFRKDEVIHGKEALLSIEREDPYLDKVQNHSTIALYHSWALRKDSGDYFRNIASDESGILMMMARDKMLGVQFHPESFISRAGAQILKNWLKF